jgi:Zn finger protein HypA/HybF involved in hydrogenase expression
MKVIHTDPTLGRWPSHTANTRQDCPMCLNNTLPAGSFDLTSVVIAAIRQPMACEACGGTALMPDLTTPCDKCGGTGFPHRMANTTDEKSVSGKSISHACPTCGDVHLMTGKSSHIPRYGDKA